MSGRNGSVRIIAGAWRGRRIRLPAGTPVRPTPDRVRETAFNWLGPAIAGMRCLDLFAGSGAMGLEALSRGAAAAVFVEQDPRLAAAIEKTAAEFGASDARVVRADAAAWLAGRAAAPRPAEGSFDFVALDPPYALPVLPLIELIVPLLAAGGVLYLERAAADGLPQPDGMHWRRRSRAGQIEYGIAVADGYNG